jgi:hypothetical protein
MRLPSLPVRFSSLPLLLAVACSDAGGGPGAATEPGSPGGGASPELPPQSGLPSADAGDPAAPGPEDGGADARTHDAARAPPPPNPPPPIGQIPWETGPAVGFGVARKDTQNPLGESVVLAYAGYGVSLEAAEAWATALYEASLGARGVRYLWAIQGPNTPEYTNQEIGNSKIVAALLPRVTAKTKFVLAVGHSSGSFVAHELLAQLAGGEDPGNVTDKRVVYFDLDGGQSGLTAASVGRLRRAYFVSSHDGATSSPNAGSMQSLGTEYAGAGGYLQNDASGSGCNAGATWCVHVTLVTTKPHDPSNASAQLDYSDFAGRPVCKAYIDAKATAAGL